MAKSSGSYKQSGPSAWEKTVGRPGSKGPAKAAPPNPSARKMINSTVGGPKNSPNYKQVK